MIKFLSQANPPDLDADVCIVGGGVAGITLALALERLTDMKIVLLEGGERRVSEDQQRLYRGLAHGLPARPLSESRFRCLGGSSSRWYGRCVPFEDYDFQHRSWVPDSGWPISGGDLEPFYRAAADVTGIRRPRSIDQQANHKRSTEFGSSRLSVRWVDIRMTHFGIRYRRRLARSRMTTVLLRAQVLKLRRAGGSTGWSMAVASLDGTHKQVTAERVVLAAGGIENARLLLLSELNRQWPVVDCPIGRYFMDHAYVEGAEIRADPGPAWSDFTLRRDHGSVAHLTLSQRELTEGELHGCGAYLLPRYARQDREGSDLSALRELRQAAQRRDSSRTLAALSPAARALPGSLSTLARRAAERLRSPQSLIFRSVHEQAPNRDNQVALGEARDAFDRPMPVVSWHTTQQDARSLKAFHEIAGAEIERLQLGRLVMRLDFSDRGWRQHIHSARHHMGTTRIGEDPLTSVVDEHCKVHGFDGLFIAGSSVFPTYSWVNPTLTIIALALRLADHLRNETPTKVERAGTSPPS